MKPNRVTAVVERFRQTATLRGAEIGVWKGSFSDMILTQMPNLTLIMVDRWQQTPPGDSYFEGSLKISRMSQQAFNDAYNIVIGKMTKFPNRHQIIRGESDRASFKYPDDYFDFVFIDADHSYPGVTKDINAWYPKVKVGGWLCGHDYDHPEQGEVKRAVHDFLRRESLPEDALMLSYNRTWFYKKIKA